ncbi:unnamed protein product [Peronospora farinosa]|uniref:MYG1 protein n=1 Tax=Peronospora farinosa TaxID=134698 RepID=A0AAV0STR0_9STRA|nr:unnamed protein product [Peronospora farinosa]
MAATPTKAAVFVASAPCFEAFRDVLVMSQTASTSTKLIGTHNGTFHCDEALAVSMLKLLPKFAAHDVLRTRDEAKLAQCEVVVDVGVLVSCTSISVVRSFKKLADPTKLDDETLDILYRKAYKNFIEHIDGIDNGVEVASAGDAKLKYNYQVSTTLSSRVSYLNPRWNESQDEQGMSRQFKQAMYMTITEFTDAIHDLVYSWLPAREIVEKAVANRFETHKSGEIVHFPKFCPWKSHLYDLEEKLLIQGQIKFVLYNDPTGNMTRVQALNVEPGSFALRKGLLPLWRSLRNEELSRVSGIEGCTFVHNAGFIGGNRTFKGALEMAVKSIEATDEETK